MLNLACTLMGFRWSKRFYPVQVKIALLLLSCLAMHAQNHHMGTVLALDTKEPLEFVSVFNDRDQNLTNVEGRFLFTSHQDSIYFHTPGFVRYASTFAHVKDTVYLERRVIDLDEVVVTNAKTILQRIKDSIPNNYLLTPSTERFFLRVLLKRNDSIVRLQDMFGQLRRKTTIYTGDMELKKKDFEVELLEMRQAGLQKDQNNVYFIFPSLYRIITEFLRINAMGPNFEVVEKPLLHTGQIRVDFSLMPSADTLNHSRGHYIINTRDNAIHSFTVEVNQTLPAEQLKKTEYGHTPFLESYVRYEKDKDQQKYYMKYGKQQAVVVSKTKDQERPTTFKIEVIWHTTDPLGQLPVKGNVNEQKDVFKLKIPYNDAYWQSQNQLLLTKEMEDFLLRLNKADTSFKVRNNMK